MLPNLIGESPQINFLFSPRPEVVITIFHATFTMEMSVLLCPYRVIKWVIKFGFRSKNFDFSINVRFSTCWFFFFYGCLSSVYTTPLSSSNLHSITSIWFGRKTRKNFRGEIWTFVRWNRIRDGARKKCQLRLKSDNFFGRFCFFCW